MSRFSRLVRDVGRRRWFASFGSALIARADTALFRLSHHWLDAPLRRDLPTLVLETTGRTTGKRRLAPLLFVEEDGGGWAVVATNWGGPQHPGWSANLTADPSAVVHLGDRSVPVTARRVGGTAFEDRWARFVALWPAFEDYRARTGRAIRMFVLDPV